MIPTFNPTATLARRFVLLALLGLAITGTNQPHAQAAESPPNFVRGQFRVLNDNGAWSWFMDERALVDRGRLIVGSVRASGEFADTHLPGWGNVELAVLDLETGESRVIVLHEHFEQDDHDGPGLLVLADGRYLAMYSKHNQESKFYVRISARPGNPYDWEPVQEVITPGVAGRFRGDSVTYSNPFRFPAEKNRLYLFHRGVGNDPNYLLSDDDGRSWRYGGKLLIGTRGYSPYSKYASDGIDTLHFVVTENHPRNFDNSLYHGFVRHGELHLSDGSPIGPLATDSNTVHRAWDFTRIYQGGPSNVAWMSDLHLDRRGRPVVLFTVQRDGAGQPMGAGGLDHRFHYGRWDASQWNVHEIAFAGTRLYPGEDDYTGLGAIDPQDTSVVFISTDADPTTGRPLISRANYRRHHELFRGLTQDDGATWQWTPITSNSTTDNLRPIVPIVPMVNGTNAGRTILVWMRGAYRVNRGEWSTKVAVSLLSPEDFASSTAGLRPVDLRCEDQEAPIAIDSIRPRLRWALEAPPIPRHRRQSAYRILVASSESHLGQDRGDLWDSGVVSSDQQTQIPYGGLTLSSNQDAFWKVQVWDEHQQPGPWSAPARWRTALLTDTDWRARWIHADSPATNPLPVFRKSFRIDRPLRRAIVHVAGLGHHDLLIDDRKVSGHFLDPAWSDYGKTVYYSTHDVTDRLRPGAHAFGLMLGKGFYNTEGDRRVHGVHAHRPLKAILQAHLTFDDGHVELIVSDDSWRAQSGPVTHSAILGGEDHDARRLPPEWCSPDFNDDSWQAAQETDGPGGTLSAAIAPPMAVHEVFHPVQIDEPEPGVFVYDFGQNASAIPRLRARGAAGNTIRLTPAEQRHGMQPRRNDGRGTVDQAGVGQPNYFEYTLRGDERETWSPQFTYSGFQYLQVTGAVPAGHPNLAGLPVLDELVSLHVRNQSPRVGHFECSEPLFNRIDEIIDWAVRGNLAHVLTDCPHREKLGWLEVAYLMGPSIAGRYDLTRFYRKIARDGVESQADDGRIPTVAPAFPEFSGGFAYTPEWGAAAVVVPWLLYEWYGDARTLEDAYPAMRRFVDYLRDTSTDLVPIPGLGDWYDYGHGKPVGPSQFTPPELTAMATFQRCAQIVADTARVLNRSEDHQRYDHLARAVTEAFNRRWFDAVSTYANHGSPQTANSMALNLGIAPPDRAPAVLDTLISDIRTRGNQQTAGDIGHAYLLRALSGAGRSDVIADLTLRTDLGSYGFIVNNGWTSMPEAWDANTGASMNHCMLGHIQEWFLGDLAGIRPDPVHPGGAAFLIAPNPIAGLTWVRGRYDSPRGRISSHWRREGSRFQLDLILPPNTRARLVLPSAEGTPIMESEFPIPAEHRNLPIRRTRQTATMELGSGAYRFTSTLPD